MTQFQLTDRPTRKGVCALRKCARTTLVWNTDHSEQALTDLATAGLMTGKGQASLRLV